VTRTLSLDAFHAVTIMFMPSKGFWGIFGPGGLIGEKRRAMPDFPNPGGAYLSLPSHTYRATIRR
jgi:hypothetical protein